MRRDARDLLVEPPPIAVEGAVDGVHDRCPQRAAERRGHQPGVVVDRLELVGALVAVQQWWSSENDVPISSLGASANTDSSFAFVRESPEANSVTSWPASTRPSASSQTTHSMPP